MEPPIVSTHYSLAQKPIEMMTQAKLWASAIRKWSRKNGSAIPIFMYSGMSGVASATALALALHRGDRKNKSPFQFGMMYVRKKGEKSHGEPVEHDLKQHADDQSFWDRAVPVFVDDFICSGDTGRFVVEECANKLERLSEYEEFKAPGWVADIIENPSINRVKKLQFNYSPYNNVRDGVETW
jgi:hypothetical protein